jgi:hypothetical protein
MDEGGAVVLAKIVGVLVLIGLALWIIFRVIGIIAGTIWFLFEFLVIAAIVGAVYHYFKHQKARGT